VASNWWVDDRSQAQACPVLEKFKPAGDPDRPYRLYRLLSDLEDFLTEEPSPEQLQQMISLVQCYLESNPWLAFEPPQPDPETGWAVQTLYDEPWFPWTVQLVAGLPGTMSPVHNHGTWGLVALLAGIEENQFWQRSPRNPKLNKLDAAGTLQLQAGDTIAFCPEAIHRIRVVGDLPTLSFNLYGTTDFDRRYLFDLETDRAELF
jgi:predicted metal-dependent enzyme (double-stranded beta helix superfamily)